MSGKEILARWRGGGLAGAAAGVDAPQVSWASACSRCHSDTAQPNFKWASPSSSTVRPCDGEGGVCAGGGVNDKWCTVNPWEGDLPGQLVAQAPQPGLDSVQHLRVVPGERAGRIEASESLLGGEAARWGRRCGCLREEAGRIYTEK